MPFFFSSLLEIVQVRTQVALYSSCTQRSFRFYLRYNTDAQSGGETLNGPGLNQQQIMIFSQKPLVLHFIWYATPAYRRENNSEQHVSSTVIRKFVIPNHIFGSKVGLQREIFQRCWPEKFRLKTRLFYLIPYSKYICRLATKLLGRYESNKIFQMSFACRVFNTLHEYQNLI